MDLIVRRSYFLLASLNYLNKLFSRRSYFLLASLSNMLPSSLRYAKYDLPNMLPSSLRYATSDFPNMLPCGKRIPQIDDFTPALVAVLISVDYPDG